MNTSTGKKKVTVIPQEIRDNIKDLSLPPEEEELLFKDLATLNNLELMTKWLEELNAHLSQRI